MSSTDRVTIESLRAGGQKLGKYEISRQLGAGGMGAVFLAVDSDLKRTVALKVLPSERAANPTLVRRFKSEGQAAALLKHRNIVSVYESGQIGDNLFLALEYVDGVDLLEWVNHRGPLPVKKSIEIMRQAAEALQHAFERGIVHRDIKPSNIMIARDGTIKITDMGLARSVDDTLDTTITRAGTTVGTVDYMAPEQASNSKAADIRSDLYSLGCTWYHLLTGTPPFPEGSVTNKVTAHLTAPIPDPRTFNKKIPEAVVAIMQRLMAKTKEQRYQTPAEFIEDLKSPGLMFDSHEPDLMALLEDDLDVIHSLQQSGRSSSSGTSSTGFMIGGKNGNPPLRLDSDFVADSLAQNTSSTRTDLKASPPVPNRPKKKRAPLSQFSNPSAELAETKKDPPWGIIILFAIILTLALCVQLIFKSYASYLNSQDKVIQPFHEAHVE